VLATLSLSKSKRQKTVTEQASTILSLGKANEEIFK
jgi:hypothetical protein